MTGQAEGRKLLHKEVIMGFPQIVGLFLGLLIIISMYLIVLKMGYNPFVAALILVPVINCIFIIIIAFRKSPNESELEALKLKYEPTPQTNVVEDFPDDGQELDEVQVCYYCKTENPPGIEKCIVCARKLYSVDNN